MTHDERDRSDEHHSVKLLTFLVPSSSLADLVSNIVMTPRTSEDTPRPQLAARLSGDTDKVLIKSYKTPRMIYSDRELHQGC